MDTSSIPKPRPVPTPVSEPFWDGLRDERLAMQRCGDCQAWVFYPRNRCPVCLSAALSWHDVEASGVVYTLAVSHQPTAPPFADEVPQVLAVVELGNGVRITTTLVGVDPDEATIGMAVVGLYDHGDDGMTLLRFTLPGR